MIAYIYSTKSGVFLEEKSGSLDIITQGLFPNTYFTTIAPPNYKQTWRWVDTEWVELLPINNPDIPYGDEYIWSKEQNQWVICPELDAYKYLEQQDEVKKMITDIEHFIETWLPHYEKENRRYMTVSIGCTGGQHRSVYIAEMLTQHFKKQRNNIAIRHRDLS